MSILCGSKTAFCVAWAGSGWEGVAKGGRRVLERWGEHLKIDHIEIDHIAGGRFNRVTPSNIDPSDA